MTKICVVFVLLVLFAGEMVAQIGQPVLKRKGNKVIEISNMLGTVEGFECLRESRPIIGTVLKRSYDEEETTMVSFVLRDAKDNRHFINLNDDQVGLLGRTTHTIISSLIAKGSRLQVWTYDCNGGGSGIFTYASRIKVL